MDRFIFSMRGYLRPRVDPKSKPDYLLMPGISEMLSNLQQQYPMALVSARESRSALDFLKHFELTHYFAVIVTGETTRFTKPNPDPLLYVSEKLNISTSGMVMIGDTVVDILTGKAAGAQTVGVLCGFGIEKELRRAGADLILEKTTHLPVALK
jgi:phosphoglycolate phosphatase-like HAD superfamily hydrolase